MTSSPIAPDLWRRWSYIERIEACCTGLADFPERGTGRDSLRPGLRTLGFERRVLIAFHIGTDTVTIDRILYRGRDFDVLLAAPDESI